MFFPTVAIDFVLPVSNFSLLGEKKEKEYIILGTLYMLMMHGSVIQSCGYMFLNFTIFILIDFKHFFW